MKQLQKIFGAMFLIMGIVVIATWPVERPIAQSIDSAEFRLPSKESLVKGMMEDPKIAELKARNAKLDKVADTIIKDGNDILTNAKGVEKDLNKNLETAKRINQRLAQRAVYRANPDTLRWVDSSKGETKSGWWQRFWGKRKASN